MNKELFLMEIRMIVHHMATSNGNLVKRFSNVALKILSLHSDCLNQEMKKQLEDIQEYIQERIDFSLNPMNQTVNIKNLKKEKTKQMIDQLLEITYSVEDKK
ncbi:MAG: hypothetical protein PHD83_03915 [Caldisericia bacterium]|nr:hypothetical protein [Caldisericia bacterium]